MRKVSPNKQTLDAIGKKLVKSEAGRTPDIESIVSNPYLFASVKARIASDCDGSGQSPAFALTSFIRSHMAAIAGAAAVLVLVVGALSLLDTGRGVVAVQSFQIPEALPDVARPVLPLQGTETGKLSAGRAIKDEIRAEKIVATRSNERVYEPRKYAEPVRDFYPVAYTGDPNETAGGGRIIRVEMKRSSLFALGLNLPLENDEETVRADLLVSSDGVTRAVRVVK